MRKHHAVKLVEKTSSLRAREVHSHIFKTENKGKIDDNVMYIQHEYIIRHVHVVCAVMELLSFLFNYLESCKIYAKCVMHINVF
jgi:hypothetical protein